MQSSSDKKSWIGCFSIIAVIIILLTVFSIVANGKKRDAKKMRSQVYTSRPAATAVPTPTQTLKFQKWLDGSGVTSVPGTSHYGYAPIPTTAITSEKVDECDDKEDIVYITRTGECYHRNGCRYLSESRIEIEREEVIDMGYRACSVCNP